MQKIHFGLSAARLLAQIVLIPLLIAGVVLLSSGLLFPGFVLGIVWLSLAWGVWVPAILRAAYRAEYSTFHAPDIAEGDYARLRSFRVRRMARQGQQVPAFGLRADVATVATLSAFWLLLLAIASMAMTYTG